MSWLTLVIGRVLGTIRTAGLAPQTQDSQTGGSNSTAVESKLANKELKPKRAVAQRVSQGKSRKAETSCAPTRTKKSSTTGTQQAPLVPPSAKQKPKSKTKSAPSTLADKSPKQEPKSARKTSGQTGKRKTTA